MAAFAFALPDEDPRPPSGTRGRAAGAVPPQWFAFRYIAGDAATRAATWRSLRDLAALNIERRVWAVRALPSYEQRLEALAADITASGGVASVELAGNGTPHDAWLHSRLRRACEHLWDDVTTRTDWYDARHLRGEQAPARQAEELAGIYELFGEVVGVDIVRSEAGLRIESRLRRLADELLAAAAVDPLAWCRTHAHAQRRCELLGECPLADGSSWFAARLRPSVHPWWEAAFQRFEATTYRPTSSRVPLEIGTFRWTATAGSADAVLAGLDERLRRFEAVVT